MGAPSQIDRTGRVQSGDSFAGIPDLADLIHGAAKPVIAVINAEAAGTAYWLIALAGEIVATRLGELVWVAAAR